MYGDFTLFGISNRRAGIAMVFNLDANWYYYVAVQKSRQLITIGCTQLLTLQKETK